MLCRSTLVYDIFIFGSALNGSTYYINEATNCDFYYGKGENIWSNLVEESRYSHLEDTVKNLTAFRRIIKVKQTSDKIIKWFSNFELIIYEIPQKKQLLKHPFGSHNARMKITTLLPQKPDSTRMIITWQCIHTLFVAVFL